MEKPPCSHCGGTVYRCGRCQREYCAGECGDIGYHGIDKCVQA